MALHSNERIRTLELSEPELERDGVRFVTMYSPALGGRADVSLYIPPAAEVAPALPIVLLLHGVYGSHWAWFFKGAAHRIAAELIAANRIRPMVLVAPSDGLQRDGSGYLRHPARNAEEWITRDLLDGLRKTYPCLGEGATIFAAGLSMGGYGALRLGAKYPHLFGGIAAHSAITDISQMDMFTFEPFSTEGIDAQDLDVLTWMDRNRELLPPLRFDCGLDDQLLAGNRRLHAALVQRSIPHTYCEAEGGHDWSYWRTHLTDTLLFFEEVLAQKEKTR